MKRITAAVGAIALGAMVAVAGAVPANAVNINNATPVALTIHKHAKTATNGVTPGVGNETNASVPGAGINGVTFSVQRVGTIDLTTDAGWQQVAAIRAAIAGGQTPTQAVSGYTLGTAVTGTTATNAGEDGYLQFTQAANGLTKSMYLVTETAAPSTVTTRSDPFLVTLPQANTANDTWIYDVQVYPKNGVTSLNKTVIAPTAQETAAGRDLVRWNITASVPILPTTQPATTVNSFVVSDTINPTNLAFVTNVTGLTGVAAPTVTLRNAANTADVALTIGAANTNDVTIAPSTTGGATQLKATFNASGLTKLQANQGGLVTFNVLARVISVPTNGQITNTAGTSINGTTNGAIDGTQTGPVVSATTPFANLTIFTYAQGTNTNQLGGAVYALLDSAGNAVIVNGVAVTGTADPTTGQVTFPNIPATGGTNNYQVAVTTNVPGYTLVGATPRPVTVVAGTPVIPADPKTAGNNYVPVAFQQVPAWALPLTGGDGGLWFGIGGGALLAVAIGAAVVIGNRRRRAATVEA
ncbi:SpaH/EbpB family LPXTG-anchored major pilin [Microbacterium sp. CJ88]|uniref:SpaH/EbpB family LPXTG-anchored major pilin n=1 Tax=Microbacterium sp. CJ88 TaxID=3445672 RepID=UPI003F658D7E